MAIIITKFAIRAEIKNVTRGGIMKSVCAMIASWYSVSLIGFLIYIRKGFLQMSGESSLPSIDLNCSDENFDCDKFSDLT